MPSKGITHQYLISICPQRPSYLADPRIEGLFQDGDLLLHALQARVHVCHGTSGALLRSLNHAPHLLPHLHGQLDTVCLKHSLHFGLKGRHDCENQTSIYLISYWRLTPSKSAWLPSRRPAQLKEIFTRPTVNKLLNVYIDK